MQIFSCGDNFWGDVWERCLMRRKYQQGKTLAKNKNSCQQI